MHRRQQLTLHTLALTGLLLLLWMWLGYLRSSTTASFATASHYYGFTWGEGQFRFESNEYIRYSPTGIATKPGFNIHTETLDPEKPTIVFAPAWTVARHLWIDIVEWIGIGQWLIFLIYLAIWPTGYLLWLRWKRSKLRSLRPAVEPPF